MFVNDSPSNPDELGRFGSTLNPRQTKIVEGLELVGLGPVRFFRDACRVMNGEVALDTATHTVAHYLREVNGAVRDVLKPIVASKRRREIEDMEKGSNRAWINEMVPLLGFNDPEIVIKRWWSVASRLDTLAHRNALVMPRPIDESFRQVWSDAQDVFGLLVQQFASSFLAVLPSIDALAATATPGKKAVSALRNTVPQNVVALDRFFGQLKSPAWLIPLRTHSDYLTNPPPLPRDDDGSVRYAQWPAGQYLVRMASIESARQELIDIALALETDNAEAHQRIVEVALAMPIADAVRLVDKICEFLRSPYQWRLPLTATDLARELVAGGEVDAGLSLLRQVLASPRVSGDQWLVAHTVEESAKDFFPAAGVSGVELLCDLLSDVLSERREAEPESDQDYSHIWRPLLEHDRSRDSRDALVTALRKALSSIAGSDPVSIPSLVERLENRQLAIYRRLALDLLHAYPDGHAELIASCLTTEQLFRDFHYRREYTRLARDHFPGLDSAQQTQILEWITRDRDDDDPEERDRHEWRELSRLGRPLPGQWERHLEELVARFGEYEERDVPGFASFSGPTAPLTKEELAAKPVEDVLRLLKEWQPDGAWGTPAPDGLARLLGEVVAADPVLYARAARGFADVDPTYARALISGLGIALRDGRTFDWSPVFDFARTAVTKPRVLAGRDENNWDVDPGWKWTRKELAHFLSAAFQADPPLPLEFADEAFAILQELADDPDPSREEESDRGEGMDPATLSLNTVRGATFHALMAYVWWRAKRREATGLPRDGLEARVADRLERHLAPEHEPTLTIRSIYGQWFPYLATVDEEWVRAHVLRVFPLDPADADLRDIAWETYVTFNRAYKNTLDLLREEYAAEIEAVGTRTTNVRPGGRDRDESLVDHLLTLYGHGYIELGDPLVERFFSLAPLQLRKRAIEFVGLSLTNATAVDEDETARFAELWANRLSAFKAGQTSADELTGFAWWFSAGKLDDTWSLTQLRALLANSGRVDPDHTVAERLATLVDSHVDPVVECLSLLIDASDRRWFVQGARDEIRTILARGLSSGNGASKTAREIVNRLAAHGHTQFTDLL